MKVTDLGVLAAVWILSRFSYIQLNDGRSAGTQEGVDSPTDASSLRAWHMCSYYYYIETSISVEMEEDDSRFFEVIDLLVPFFHSISVIIDYD